MGHGYGEQAGGVGEGAVAGAAVGSEVKDAGLGVVGGAGAEAAGGIAEGVEGGGGEGADGCEIGAGSGERKGEKQKDRKHRREIRMRMRIREGSREDAKRFFTAEAQRTQRVPEFGRDGSPTRPVGRLEVKFSVGTDEGFSRGRPHPLHGGEGFGDARAGAGASLPGFKAWI